MRFSAAVITAIIGAVAAQDISQIPQCAQGCIKDAVSSATDCKQDDYKCVCENQKALVGASTSCVISKCGADKATSEVLPATEKFCKEVQAGGGGSGGSSSSAGGASSSAAASTPAGSSAATATATESGSAPASSAASPTSGGSGGSYPTGSNGTATAAPTSAVTAGAAVAGSVGSFAMLVLGAAAAL